MSISAPDACDVLLMTFVSAHQDGPAQPASTSADDRQTAAIRAHVRAMLTRARNSTPA